MADLPHTAWARLEALKLAMGSVAVVSADCDPVVIAAKLEAYLVGGLARETKPTGGGAIHMIDPLATKAEVLASIDRVKAQVAKAEERQVIMGQIKALEDQIAHLMHSLSGVK